MRPRTLAGHPPARPYAPALRCALALLVHGADEGGHEPLGGAALPRLGTIHINTAGDQRPRCGVEAVPAGEPKIVRHDPLGK